MWLGLPDTKLLEHRLPLHRYDDHMQDDDRGDGSADCGKRLGDCQAEGRAAGGHDDRRAQGQDYCKGEGR